MGWENDRQGRGVAKTLDPEAAGKSTNDQAAMSEFQIYGRLRTDDSAKIFSALRPLFESVGGEETMIFHRGPLQIEVYGDASGYLVGGDTDGEHDDVRMTVREMQRALETAGIDSSLEIMQEDGTSECFESAHFR